MISYAADQGTADDVAASATSTGMTPTGSDPRRCLVVEDESDTATVLSYHLKRLGFQTTVAESGELAERYLRDELWDLVIVDVVLPDIDGRDLVPSIRALDSHPEVILTSVLSAADLVDHCADALLSKPFRGVDVTAAVHTARKAA